MLEHKTYDVAEIKTTGSKTDGRFEAIVSVAGNVDKENDRMVKGAFKRSVSSKADGGRGFPAVVYSHLWNTVPIGVPQKCEEVEGYEVKADDGTSRKVDGLFVDAELFVDDIVLAKEVYTAMSRKGGDGLPPLREFSFGYKAMKFDYTTETIDGKSTRVRELKDVDLYEVGPTLVGMNGETHLVGTKALPAAMLELLTKAGARNSANDAERLQEIHDITVALEASCTGKSARDMPKLPDLLIKAGLDDIGTKLDTAITGKAFDDIDSYAIWLLTDMISTGTSFIAQEDDEADIARMRDYVTGLAQMLVDEIAEIGADIGTAAARDVAKKGRLSPDKKRELLLAFPR